MNQSFRTDNKRTMGNNLHEKKISVVEMKTDDNIKLRSDVRTIPKIQSQKETGVLDIDSIKLGSVDEEDEGSEGPTVDKITQGPTLEKVTSPNMDKVKSIRIPVAQNLMNSTD